VGKFAVYSDLHIHPWEYGATEDTYGSNTRLREQYFFLYQLGKYCKENNIMELFFCGDFFHTHGRVATNALFLGTQGLRYIAAQGVSQWLIVGNHDISKNFKDTFPLEPNSLEQFSVFSKVVSSPVIGKYLTHPNILVSMIPFTESASLLATNLEMVRRVSDKHPHYLFLHQGVAKAPMGSGYLIDEILTPAMIPDNVTRAFTGHYHTHQDLGKLVIVGPPMQHTWADTKEEGGILVVDTETGEFTRQQVHDNPKFVNVEAGFLRALSNLAEADDLRNIVYENFIRVNNVSDMSLEKAEALKECLLKLGAHSVELKFAEKHSNPLDKESSKFLSMEELLGEFEKGLTDRQRQIGEELRKGSYEVPKS
jgi:hypothetical protein